MILADTHLLLWSALDSPRLSQPAKQAILAAAGKRWFSVASIWEVVVKRARHASFDADAASLRSGLLSNGWRELGVGGEHALAVADLPPIHNDPFDRILLAQAKVEGLTLLTSDKIVARYPGKVMKV